MSGFTESQVSMLEMLPAVDHVDAASGRIYYSEEFKRQIVLGRREGIGATAMFRAAGLPPELIGRKRIERAVARWTDGPRGEAGDVDAGENAGEGVGVPMRVFLAQTVRLNLLETRVSRLEHACEGSRS